MNRIAQKRCLQKLLINSVKSAFHSPQQCRCMYTKRYNITPLDEIDKRGDQLHRILDKLDREVTMRVWQETLKVVDTVNAGTPLERRQLPVIFVKTMDHESSIKPDYPLQSIPNVIEKGTVMWWSIDDVFERVINPGYGLFATAENVQAYGNFPVTLNYLNKSDDLAKNSYDDHILMDLLETSVFTTSSPVSKSDVLQYLREELNVFVASEDLIDLPQTLTSPGRYLVPLKINSDGCIDNVNVEIVS